MFSDRPLPTYKTSIVVTVTIFTSFKANTKETTKEVARPKVNIVAVTTILVVHVGNGQSEHV